MADNKFTFKGVADVKDVIKGIQEIQAALNKLQLKPDMKAGFERIFQNMERQAEKANTAMASGFKNKGDVKHYTDAMGQITRAYDDIILKIEKLKTQKIKFNFDTQEVTNIRQELASLEQAAQNAAQRVKAIGDALGKSQQIQDVIQRRATNTKGGQQWKDIFDNLNPDNIDKAIKKVEELQAKIDEGMDKGKAKAYWQSVQTDLNVVKGDIQQYTTALDQQSDAEEKTAQKAEQLDAALHNVGGELDAASNAAKTGGRNFEDWARGAQEAATGTQQLNSELDHFKSKTAYFFGISNAINLFKRAVRSAYNTVKDLDAVMTETAVVTDFNVGDMWSQLPEYTARANELGVTIHDTYEAATLFYQQGLKTNEVMQISNETLKMARIAGLDAATASDRMTNALRGFNMELDKTSAQRVNDVYSKLAAITASNTDEISTAMTKVASLAHNANMEFETTAAFLAQIIESTRESAETAGTALKTVVARFSEVKKLYTKGELMGQDEEGEEIDVNKVSTALRSAGINLNEYLTGAKGLDDIFIELASKWDSLDQVQQRYIATMAAGSRQQSRFIALMSDYQRTMQLVDAANNANGASQEQYNKTLESLQTKLARLKNAWNEFILGLANSDAIKKAVDLLTGLITNINKLIKTISGKNSGVKMITTFITAFTAFRVGKNIFNKGSTGGFFGQLMSFGNREAARIGANNASVFYSSFADKFVKYSKSGGIISTVEKGEAYLGKKLNSFFTADASFMQGTLADKLVPEIGQEKFNAFWNTLDKGNLTIDQLNASLKATGSNLQIDATNAEQFGIKWKGNNTVIGQGVVELKQASAAAMALGSIFIMVGGVLEKQGGEWEIFGKIIKGLGAGLVVFGTIISVWLPLQVQIGAKGISAAIYNIPIIGWITLVISLVVSLGAAIAGIAKDNSAEAKLKKAAEAAESAAEAADEAKKAFNELKETWNELDDKYDAIESATKGTREWKDAVKELNDQVLELLNTYEGIQVERDADGILKITNKEEYLNNQRQKTLEAEATARFAKMAQYEADLNAQYSGLSNISGTKPIKGTIDKLQASGELEKVADMTYDEVYKIIEQDYTERGLAGPNATYNNYQYPGYSVKDLQVYAKNYKENQALMKTEQEAFASTILENANINEDKQKYANTFLSDEYLADLTERNQKTYAGLWEGDTKTKYAKSKGYDKWSDYVSNHQEDKDVSKEELQSRMAAADALSEATSQVELFTKNLANIEDEKIQNLFEEQNGGALTRTQAANLNNYTDDQIEALYNSLGGNSVYGEGGLDSFREWFKNSVDEAISNFDATKYGAMFNGYISSSLTESLTSDTFKDFAENMWSVYITSGKKGMDAIQESLTDMTKDMEPEQIDKFIDSINKLDWTSIDSINSLEDLAKEYGISEEAIKSLEQQIIEFNDAVNKVDLEKLKTFLGLAANISSGEHGRSFTEEEYNNAIENGVNEKDFVYNVATGNYDYIGKNLENITTSALERANNYAKQLDKEYASGLAVKEVMKEQPDVNTGDEDSLRKFLGSYIYAAGDNALFNSNVLSGDLSQLQDAYYKAVQTGLNIADIEQNRQENDTMRYQLMSGSQNATNALLGDENAQNALALKIANSGLPEKLVESLLEGISNGETIRTERAGALSDIVDKANNLGIDMEELNTYAEALRSVEGLENARIETLYALALANRQYQDGFEKIINSYDDWIALKQEDGSIKPDNGDLAQLKAYDQLKKDLKEMLNLSKDVSDEFMQMPETAELLEKAINGDTDAVIELRNNIAKLDVMNSGKIAERAQSEIVDAIDELTENSTDLEFGATLDDSKFAQGLATILEQAGVGAEEMQKIFEDLGWAPEIEYEWVDFEDVQKNNTSGWQEIITDPEKGTKQRVPVNGLQEYAVDHKVMIPKVGKATYVKPTIPSTSKKSSSSSGSGGGGGSSKKPSYWENPYDELYNLQQKINEALRTREALERRYQKLLKQEQATLADIRKSYYSQINNLRYEADLQKQFAAGRLRQINEIGSKIYTDSEGNRKTFNSLGVTKYASYNASTGLITIDWEGLEAISKDSSREEEGKAAEAYISKLEELVDSYEEVRDKLWDIEDKIEEIRDAAIDSYLSFEDRVMEAIVNDRQNQIDSYQSMSDAIEKANSEVIDSLREQIDLSRQIRDNTEKEQDIADMENRLAYLQRDTSGANALEIQKLQKDLEDARESYTDTLVDQAIDKMQNDADLAAEQRARQIETMQEQLEIMKNTGVLWDNVYSLMNEAAEGDGALSPHSNLVKLLQETEAFSSLSNIGQAKWWSEVAEEFHKAWIGLSEAEDKYKTDANNDGKINDSGTSSAIEEVQQAPATTPTPAPTTTSSKPSYDDKTKYGVALAVCDGYWGNGDARKKNLESKGFNYSEIQGIVNKVYRDSQSGAWYGKYYGIKDTSQYRMSKFKTGGLADFTGPAWLDGTKTRPELILNAQDSANFIALKDILASLLNVQGGRGIGGNGGDNYFDIDISANLGSDYDVDKLTEKIKRDIYQDGQYRNVNTINYLR